MCLFHHASSTPIKRHNVGHYLLRGLPPGCLAYHKNMGHILLYQRSWLRSGKAFRLCQRCGLAVVSRGLDFYLLPGFPDAHSTYALPEPYRLKLSARYHVGVHHPLPLAH